MSNTNKSIDKTFNIFAKLPVKPYFEVMENNWYCTT